MKPLFYLVLLLFLSLSAAAQTNPEQPSADSVYAQVDSIACFPGGDWGWTRYMMRNLRYPAEAMQRGIEGKVMVQFVINEKGRIINVSALTGDKILQEEAVRLIKQGPKWLPAIKNGRKVKSYHQQSIVFKVA